ncbi:MAG: hypothetical protein RTU30_08510 [Candidatus Thorarchaeota archaeon]
MKIHIIYLHNGPLILSKKEYNSWHEIQEEYDDYMTSLGPWPTEDVIDFLEQEYGEDDSRWAFTRTQIHSFALSDDLVIQSDL